MREWTFQWLLTEWDCPCWVYQLRHKKVNRLPNWQMNLNILQVDTTKRFHTCALELASSSAFHISVTGIIFHITPQSDTWVSPSFLSLPFTYVPLTTCPGDQTFSMSYKSIIYHKKGEMKESGQEIKFEEAPRMFLIMYLTWSAGFRFTTL